MTSTQQQKRNPDRVTEKSEHVRVWHVRKILDENSTAKETLLSVPGVQEVFTNRYEATVIKARAYTWDEVAPDVEWALKQLEE